MKKKADYFVHLWSEDKRALSLASSFRFSNV